MFLWIEIRHYRRLNELNVAIRSPRKASNGFPKHCGSRRAHSLLPAFHYQARKRGGSWMRVRHLSMTELLCRFVHCVGTARLPNLPGHTCISLMPAGSTTTPALLMSITF